MSTPQIPLLNPDRLQANLAALGPTLLIALEDAAQQFIKDNKQNVMRLGTANVKLLLDVALYSQVALDTAPECPTVEDIAAQEAVIAKREQYFQAIAEAQKEDAVATATLFANIKAFAANTALGVVSKAFSAVL